ncbi:MAG: polymer-forming cytoskeletal protein [Proteobacteria bacterium]|nr:polymer-forming cytoskeletal protein [Pseudomonadota bacterium]MDA1356246.1 polymer-forming cytoskeletal protein [Pseudomonadota bacterium]
MAGSNSDEPHVISRLSSNSMNVDGAGRAVQFHPDVPNRIIGSHPQVLSEAPQEFASDSRRLTVGRDMSLSSAEISDCDRLVIEGTIEGNLNSARYLEIDYGGVFRGTAVVDNAEIAGTFEGELTVHNRLAIHASGLVLGQVRYGQLEVERGGRINGQAEQDGKNREADPQLIGDGSQEITFPNPTFLPETD